MSIYRANQEWLARQRLGVPDSWDDWHEHDSVIKSMTESLCHVDKISRTIDMPKSFIRHRLSNHIQIDECVIRCNTNEVLHLYESGVAPTKIATLRNLPRTTVNKIIAKSGATVQKN